MNILSSRRSFLKTAAATSALMGAGDLGFLSQLRPVSAAEATIDSKLVRFNPEIEPIVRMIEDTPRQKLLEEVGARVKRGLTYRELFAALLLAGVRNIQPRPVGFKFHAVLVVNSAHLASMNSPDSDRWLPIFWAIDQFKSSQARNTQEGDWHMGPVDESAVPPAHKAKAAFIAALENWDEAAADAAVTGLARCSGPQECFEIFARYGSRDFRDIGHKAIYVANSFRALQTIGWQHAEPVLRSLAYALMERGGANTPNPAKSDLAPDRPGRRNAKLLADIKPGWETGKPNEEATAEMLTTLRQATEADAANKVVEMLNRGVAPRSISDAYFEFGSELLMKKTGIPSLHTLTSGNALHYAFQHSAVDETRRWLMLQNASFLVLFRENVLGKNSKSEPLIEKFEGEPPTATGAEAVEEIFADVSRDKMVAARKTLAYLNAGGRPKAFLDAAQRLIYLKGSDSHDYKFSSAVMEDCLHMSRAVRDRYLAASVYWLKGSAQPDTGLVKRTREALKA